MKTNGSPRLYLCGHKHAILAPSSLTFARQGRRRDDNIL